MARSSGMRGSAMVLRMGLKEVEMERKRRSRLCMQAGLHSYVLLKEGYSEGAMMKVKNKRQKCGA